MSETTQQTALIYRFHHPDGDFHYEVADGEASFDQAGSPDWCRLDNQQCSNCPWQYPNPEYCPAATIVAPLLEQSTGLEGHEEIELEIIGPQRVTKARTTTQKALGSLLGLLLAKSGCPHTSFLRPMAHYHLPLATPQETLYRVASMYLLGQYLKGGDYPAEEDLMMALADRYLQLQTINQGLSERIEAACSRDATLNGLVVLDFLSKEISWFLEEHLQELWPLFGAIPADE